jgi:hypothetical protein
MAGEIALVLVIAVVVILFAVAAYNNGIGGRH